MFFTKMQDIREIYNKTKVKLEAVRSRLLTELQGLEYVLDNELCDTYGDPLDAETLLEATNNLIADKTEVQEELDIVNSQIKYLVDWLEKNQ